MLRKNQKRKGMKNTQKSGIAVSGYKALFNDIKSILEKAKYRATTYGFRHTGR